MSWSMPLSVHGFERLRIAEKYNVRVNCLVPTAAT